MRRIAERIEYSPTAIYLYFKDKSELLEQVCHEAFSRLSLLPKRILEQPGDPLEQLEKGLLAYVNFGVENPHPYRAAFMMPKPEDFDKFKYNKPDSPGCRHSIFCGAACKAARHPGNCALGMWSGRAKCDGAGCMG